MSRLLHKVFQWLPESVRLGITRRRAEMRGLGQLKANQALLAKHLADLEQDLQQSKASQPAEVEDSRFPAGVRSRLCTQEQLSQPWFQAWCEAMVEPPLVNRKTWEFAYVAEVLDKLGMLQSGRRGLGFGVGREPLVSLFASRGTDVVATDLAPTAKEAREWRLSDQHAFDVESMIRPGVVDPEVFRRHVTWRAVDMREIPEDLSGFDFCWSVCSLEHIGTLEAGLEFIENSLSTVAPGGIAVHTTEFNLSSNEDTVEAGPTVIYRERDIRELTDRLEAAGHEVAALDLSRGEGLLDHYVDVPPFADEPVLRFLFASYTLTSVALIVRRGSS